MTKENRKDHNWFSFILAVLELTLGNPRTRLGKGIAGVGLMLLASPWWQPVLYGIAEKWVAIDRQQLAKFEAGSTFTGWVLLAVGVTVYFLTHGTPDTPPKDDIRVKVSLGLGKPHFQPVQDFLIVKVSNHGDRPVEIKSIALELEDKRQLFCLQDDLMGNYFYGQKLAFGESCSLHLAMKPRPDDDFELSQIVCAVARDAIDRRFKSGDIRSVIQDFAKNLERS